MKLKNGSWKFEIGSQLGIKTQLCTSQCPPPAPCRSPRCHPQSPIAAVFFSAKPIFYFAVILLGRRSFSIVYAVFRDKKAIFAV